VSGIDSFVTLRKDLVNYSRSAKEQRLADKQVATFGHPAEKGEIYGFSQAVRTADTIYVAGQTASDPTGDMETQMRQAYEGIEAALSQLDATMADVVEETLFVADMPAAVECAARVRSEVFKGRFEMASTLVGTTGLGSPDLLIEIKCVARV
jgi:enamine deaminase RidA (YjgF/YER057c/UK114 family)